mmetsp:Transcript_62290/g.103571  ORF Transcript_62290/g.103571 Transcript_62290/m.103571 type:complete len:354 (+) Transcript_62290:69-1130(+)
MEAYSDDMPLCKHAPLGPGTEEGSFWHNHSSYRQELLSGKIVFALFGNASLTHLSVWRRTWLRGDVPFVFIPDAPTGPYRAFYKPLQRGHFRHHHMARTRADANMVWAVQVANLTFPNAHWVFVIDSDAFVFPASVVNATRHYDPTRSHLFALGLIRSPLRNHDTWSYCTLERQHKVNGSCYCPVCMQKPVSGMQDKPSYFLDRGRGMAHYSPPYSFAFGGTGILLSRGLLDRLPAQAWADCASRLVCGSGDLRLSICVKELQPSVHIKVISANSRFLEAANLSYNEVRANALHSNLDTNHHVRERYLQLFSERRLCPVSIHKLPPHRAELIYAASRHCTDGYSSSQTAPPSP